MGNYTLDSMQTICSGQSGTWKRGVTLSAIKGIFGTCEFLDSCDHDQIL